MSRGGDGTVHYRLHAPLPEELPVGRGQFLVISGDCDAGAGAIRSICIRVDGREQPCELSPTLNGVGFWGAVYFEPPSGRRRCDVLLAATLADGSEHAFTAGSVVACPVARIPSEPPLSSGDGEPLIAVCLASYDPEIAAFQRQLSSIQAQSHRNWICIVNDDGTPEEKWARMRELFAGDARFVFHRNESNLGFYHNFEHALARVPDAARFVALSDQDDYWYPDKLSRLLGALREGGATLAYSDMRIVDEEGNEVAGSYWINRRNEYVDFPVVLVANTVTGAASLFEARLLDRLLPFPPRVGDAFHDHWIACTAMCGGKLAYVDAPLYDYYQYGDSVIGHCDFVRFSLVERAASLIRFVFRLCRPSVARPLLQKKYASALAVYRGECRRLRLLCETIRRRGNPDGQRVRQLQLFQGGMSSVVRLLALHFRILVQGKTTDDAELRLAMGEFARIMERRRLAGSNANH